jgi:hypothetical protein
MTKESFEALRAYMKKHAIKPDKNNQYNVLDLLSLPLSETYRGFLLETHSEEWVKGLEEAIRDRKSGKN